MPVAAIRVASQVVIIGPLGYLEGGGFLAGWIIIVLFDHLENNRGKVYSPPVSPLGRHEKGVTNIGYNQVGLPPCLVNTVFYF